MTYFRYDNNKRGFDMAGIEWSIFDAKTLSFGDKLAIGLQSDHHEGYAAIITRNNKHIATLGEMDTARFIQVITDKGKGHWSWR